MSIVARWGDSGQRSVLVLSGLAGAPLAAQGARPELPVALARLRSEFSWLPEAERPTCPLPKSSGAWGCWGAREASAGRALASATAAC